jgi:hypothetical protein
MLLPPMIHDVEKDDITSRHQRRTLLAKEKRAETRLSLQGLGETRSLVLASKRRTEIVFSFDRTDRLKDDLRTEEKYVGHG